MTAVVGALCSDGAVIGTDSSVTSTAAGGIRTIEQLDEKLEIFRDRIIIAGAGSVGHGQRFKTVIEDAWREKVFSGVQRPTDVCVALSGATAKNFAQTQTASGSYGALVAFPVGTRPVLCEFETARFQPEIKTERMWFCSMGSTQPITDPFLALMREIFWPTGQPTVREATLAVTWTLDHAIALNTGSVNAPARIAVLARHGDGFRARLLTDADLTEHRSWIEGAKRNLAEALRETQNAPPVPRRP